MTATWYIGDSSFHMGGADTKLDSKSESEPAGGCSVRMNANVARDMARHVRPVKFFADKRYRFLKTLKLAAPRREFPPVHDPDMAERIARLGDHVRLIDQLMRQRETVDLDKVGKEGVYRVSGNQSDVSIILRNVSPRVVHDVAENFHTIVGVAKIVGIDVYEIEAEDISGARDIVAQLLDEKIGVYDEVAEGWRDGASEAMVSLGRGVSDAVQLMQSEPRAGVDSYSEIVRRDPARWISPIGIIPSRGQFMNLRDARDNL